MNGGKSENDRPVTDAELERHGFNTGGYDSGPTEEELQLLKDNYCEACKGVSWMEDTDCYEECEGFAEELAELRIEEN